MENIWTEAQIAVGENGATFEIDFERRNFKLNKKFIIKNGEYEGQLGYGAGPDIKDMKDILEMVESFYQTYKYSVPSEREDNARHRYFKALKAEDLTDEQMCTGQPRSIARLQLELYILILILNGEFKWSDEMGKWFWQSKNDKDLIILKSWICGKA